MTIPASQLVDITPRVIGGGLSGLAFVGTFLTKNDKLPASVAVPFYNLTSVGEYFGTASVEYKLASNYFLADTNSSKKPDVLWFYRKLDSAVAAFLRGLSNPAKLATLKTITNGALSIKIDGTEASLTGLDFSSATSFSDVATVISTALTSSVGVCTWDSQFQAFVITSATSGVDSTIEYASGTSAGILGLDGGTLSQGSATKTITECLEDCVKANSNFWSYMPVWDESEDEELAIAEWNNAQGVRFMYALTDKSSNGLVANNSACIAQKVADYIGVCSNYNTKALSAMIMGVGAAIDVSRLNGRKTFAYRQQSGLEFTVDNGTDALNLIGNGYNFYGDYATASNQFKLLQNGQISGSAKWIDTYFGQVYIRDGLQNAWINAMMLNNTIPYNEAGYNILRSAALDIINSAVNAGFIRQGVSLSEIQKATVESEAGLDISGSLETQGWYLQILDPTTQVRQERGTPVVSFWYMDGGSVQRIVGTSTVLL